MFLFFSGKNLLRKGGFDIHLNTALFVVAKSIHERKVNSNTIPHGKTPAVRVDHYNYNDDGLQPLTEFPPFVSSTYQLAMFPFSPTPSPPIPLFLHPGAGNADRTESPAVEAAEAAAEENSLGDAPPDYSEWSDSLTTSLRSSLSPVTPSSSPEMPDTHSPTTCRSPETLQREDGGLEEQPSESSLNYCSFLSLQSCMSTSSAYLSACEEQPSTCSSPPTTSSTPLHSSSSGAPQFPYPLWSNQPTPILISLMDCSTSDDDVEWEGKEKEEDTESFQQAHLTLPSSRCSSILSPAPSLESVASTVVDEVQHLSFPPPYFVNPVSVDSSPSPPPSAQPEWTPTKQEVLQMRSYVAGTSRWSPHMWHNTVHFIREKLEEERCCIGRHTITNGLLEVLAEAICSNLISALLLVEELLPDFRGRGVNQLFTFHPLHSSVSHCLPVELERDSTSCPAETLLHIAVHQNRPNFVRVLVQDLEASPDEEDSIGLTPLHIAVLNAVRFGSRSSQEWSTVITIISCLLGEGRADVNKPTEDGLTPLAMAVRHLLFSDIQPQLSLQFHRKQSDSFLQSLSTQASPSANEAPRKLIELLLSHGATPDASLHRMSFMRSTFTASLQSCTAEELINRLIPTVVGKEERPKPSLQQQSGHFEGKFAIRDARRCSKSTQSRLFALSGCQLVFQELQQHRLTLHSLPPKSKSSSSLDIGSSYLLLPVVQIKHHWTLSLQERESSTSLSRPCEAYCFRRELETVEDLEELWKSSNLTEEIVYQSLIIMEQCLGPDDFITLEMVLLTHNWLISALKSENANLLFLHFLESLVCRVENMPSIRTAEGFFQLLELEHFIGTVVAETDIGDTLLFRHSVSCNSIEQSPQEYVKFASCIIPVLSTQVSQCPSHLSTGQLLSVDRLISTTLQNAMSLVASRVSTYGARGSLVRWMVKNLIKTCSKVFYSDGSCTTILHVAIEMKDDSRLIAALLELGAKAVLNEQRKRGFQFDLPIHTAKAKDTVRLLIEQGAHLDAVDSEGRTASELCPFVWGGSSCVFPDKVLQSSRLPPLVCLASRAVVREHVPYTHLDLPIAVRRLIQLHSPGWTF